MDLIIMNYNLQNIITVLYIGINLYFVQLMCVLNLHFYIGLELYQKKKNE